MDTGVLPGGLPRIRLQAGCCDWPLAGRAVGRCCRDPCERWLGGCGQLVWESLALCGVKGGGRPGSYLEDRVLAVGSPSEPVACGLHVPSTSRP